MKRLYNARFLAIIFALFVASTVERFLTVPVARTLNIPPEAIEYHAISMVVLILLFMLTNFALKIFVHSNFVTKMCFGKEYVGGRWVEFITYADDESKLSHCSILDVVYEEDKIATYGVAYRYYNGKFNKWYTFKTTKSEMVDYKLSYTFSAEGCGIKFTDEGALYFIRNAKRRPNELYGVITVKDNDNSIKELKVVHGYLIEHKEEMKKLDENQPIALLKMVQKLNKEHDFGLDFGDEKKCKLKAKSISNTFHAFE